MTLLDNEYRDFGQMILEQNEALTGTYLSLKDARELRLSALNKVKFQNQEMKPYKSFEPEPETVIYSQYLKDEETGEVKMTEFKARLELNTKQYFVILLNERMYLTKQELKKLINNL